MSLKSAPYYWVECDNCGTRCDYGEFAAVYEAIEAEDLARDRDWSCEHGKHHCPHCPPLCEKCGENAGDLAAERDYLCQACFDKEPADA